MQLGRSANRPRLRRGETLGKQFCFCSVQFSTFFSPYRPLLGARSSERRSFLLLLSEADAHKIRNSTLQCKKQEQQQHKTEMHISFPRIQRFSFQNKQRKGSSLAGRINMLPCSATMASTKKTLCMFKKSFVLEHYPRNGCASNTAWVSAIFVSIDKLSILSKLCEWTIRNQIFPSLRVRVPSTQKIRPSGRNTTEESSKLKAAVHHFHHINLGRRTVTRAGNGGIWLFRIRRNMLAHGYRGKIELLRENKKNFHPPSQTVVVQQHMNTLSPDTRMFALLQISGLGTILSNKKVCKINMSFVV